jgi:O-antigen/teichoic acid export membrane protein
LRAATTVLTPAISAFEARGENGAIRAMFIDSTRYVLWFILPVQVGLHLLGKPFLALWMGPEYVDWSYPTLTILALPLSLLMSQSVSGRVLYGLGQLRWFTVVVLVEAAINLLLSLALVRRFGIEGVAWGTTIPNIIGNLVVAFHVCALLKVSFSDYLRKSFLKPLAVVCPLTAAWWGAATWAPPQHWSSFIAVVGFGLAGFGVMAVVAEFGLATVTGNTREFFARLINQVHPARQDELVG